MISIMAYNQEPKRIRPNAISERINMLISFDDADYFFNTITKLTFFKVANHIARQSKKNYRRITLPTNLSSPRIFSVVPFDNYKNCLVTNYYDLFFPVDLFSPRIFLLQFFQLFFIQKTNRGQSFL